MYRLGGRAGAIEALGVVVSVHIDYNNGSSSNIGEGRFGGIEAGGRSASGADNALQGQMGLRSRTLCA